MKPRVEVSDPKYANHIELQKHGKAFVFLVYLSAMYRRQIDLVGKTSGGDGETEFDFEVADSEAVIGPFKITISGMPTGLFCQTTIHPSDDLAVLTFFPWPGTAPEETTEVFKVQS